MSLFNNNLDFRPKGSILKLWAMLPQVTTDVDGDRVPPIFGNVKSMALANIIIVILIIMEVVLIFQLDDQGVPYITLLGLSIFDFIIAVLPMVIMFNMNMIPSIYDANIFNLKAKRDIPGEIPLKFDGKKEAYKQELNDKIDDFTKKKKMVSLLSLLFTLLIIGFGAWKFFTYWDVFGNDIFVEPIGRFVVIVILVSYIAHIGFTKTVINSRWFKMLLAAQIAERKKTNNKFRIDRGETNKTHPLKFNVEYFPVQSGNQFIAQQCECPPYEENKKDFIKRLETPSGDLECYRTNKFEKKPAFEERRLYLIYTGLLIDSEINELFIAQPNATSQKAMIAECKEIQLSQF